MHRSNCRQRPGVVVAEHTTPLPAVFARGAEQGLEFKSVRAEYTEIRLAGAQTFITTDLIIQNTSVARSSTLHESVVLGSNGLSSVLAIYNGLVGTIVPPLGQVRLSVDRQLGSGVTPRVGVTRSPNDVASAVLCDDPGNALRLTAFITEKWSDDSRATSSTESYDLTF